MTFNFTKLDKDSAVSELDANFSTAIENKIGEFTNADFAGDAGITSDKLADRFSFCTLSFVLYPTTWGAVTNGFQDADSGAHRAIIYPEFPGKEAWLVAASVSIEDYEDAATSGDEGELLILLNDGEYTVAQFTFTDTGGVGYGTGFCNNASGSSAFASPLACLHQGDFFKVILQKQTDSGSNSPTYGTITVTLTLKVELVS